MGSFNTHEEREREIEALRASISRLSAANLRFSKSPDLEPSRKRRWNPFARGPLNSASGGQGRGVVWVATLQRGVAHLGGARFGPPQRCTLRWRALAAVVGALPGKPYWKRVGTDFPRRLRQPWRAASGVSPPSPVRRTWRGRKWRERPPYFRR